MTIIAFPNAAPLPVQNPRRRGGRYPAGVVSLAVARDQRRTYLAAPPAFAPPVAVPKPWGHDSDRPDEQTMFVALNLAVCNLNLVRRMLGLAELCPERGGLRGEPV